VNRRDFLRAGGASVFGYALTKFIRPPEILAQGRRPVRNTARNAIFIMLNGGPSHVDLFDIKSNDSSKTRRIRPDNYETQLDIQNVNGIDLPMGLFPNFSKHLDKTVIVRSQWGWSAAHNIAQYWIYTSQDFNPAFAAERPSVGAVVAYEAYRRRGANDVLPGFVSLNGLPYANGFLSGVFAPFTVSANPNGLGNLLDHPDGEARFGVRWGQLQTLDAANRGANPSLGRPVSDFADFYNSTKKIMYNPTVQQTFRFTNGEGSEAQRYGNGQANGTGFGNACIVARNLMKANNGTRFVWITLGGWDMHTNIYNPGIFNLARVLDVGLGNLLADLRAEPGTQPGKSLLDETLIILNGDFGRRPGQIVASTGLNNGNGRDHWNRAMDAVFIGGGIRGGRVIGATDDTGDNITDIGWTPPDGRPGTGSFPGAGPYIRTEDLYYTMYSALGIDPSTRIADTPSRRAYDYVYRGPNTFFGEIPLW
jgi:hypothetical protein